MNPSTVSDSEDVRALLAEQAPEFAGLSLRPLPGGMDNAVVRVGEHLLARLPRTAVAAMLLRHEQRWLPQLAPRLPLPVPAPVLVGRAGAGFPYAWSLVPWLEGETADMAPYDPDTVTDALIGFLRALHVPAPQEAPGNPFRGVPLAARLERHEAALVGHPRAGELLDALRVLAEVPEADEPPLWVHGDLHPRNVVVRDGRLVGIIDFGDLHAGDRAVDLASVWMLLSSRLRGVVREALEVDAATWERGRGWGLVLGAALHEIGLRGGDAAFRQVGERTLDATCRPR